MRRWRSNLVPGTSRGQRIVTPTSPPGVAGAWRGPNLLMDGDMEAVGVADWTIANGVMTKQNIDPYQGLQYARQIQSGVPFCYFRQTVMTIGWNYRITGVGRSFAGVGRPQIFTGAFIWIGTLSTAWQTFDVSFTAGNASIFFYTRDSGAGDGTEWDALYLSLEP